MIIACILSFAVSAFCSLHVVGLASSLRQRRSSKFALLLQFEKELESSLQLARRERLVVGAVDVEQDAAGDVGDCAFVFLLFARLFSSVAAVSFGGAFLN